VLSHLIELDHQVALMIHKVVPVILMQQCSWLAVIFNRELTVLHKVLMVSVPAVVTQTSVYWLLAVSNEHEFAVCMQISVWPAGLDHDIGL